MAGPVGAWCKQGPLDRRRRIVSGLLTRVETRHKASLGTSIPCSTLMARRTRPMKNRGGQPGRHRSDARRFPYEPRIVRGKVMMPAELQRIHSSVLNDTMTGMISEETRAVVESLWPELLHKLPPKVG
jgi:hypothetical protein